MAISVTDPISRAMTRAKLITFQPFHLGKWFVLGFCAFLANLGEGGGSFNFNMPGGGGGGRKPRVPGTTPSTNPFDAVMSWIGSHHLEVALIATALALAVVSTYLVLVWLSCRGKFMFLDCIARNGAEVVAPWKRYRRLGNSLFLFRICLGGISFIAMLVIAGISLLPAWHDIQNKTFGPGAVLAIIVGIMLFLPTAVLLGLIDWCVNTFVTVIMYARDSTVCPAWREFQSNILPGNVGSLLLFLLMSILLGIGCAIMQVMLGCLTLCIGLLPYLSSVLALPLLVFMRSYAIYFLEQFGPQYVIMTEPPPRDFGFPVIMPPPLPLPPAGM